jgi:Arc/MetJ-type ribon-helix-helix transcriptional regulator
MMAKDNIVSFRIDDHLKRRINANIGLRYPNRTLLIRRAVEQLLDLEDESRSRWAVRL